MAKSPPPPPGTPLANAKHEAVALAYIADPHRIGWRAYNAVYPNVTKSSAGESFSRLSKNVKFAARLDELANAAASVAVMSAEEVLLELSRLGRANMADYMRPGRNGEPILDFSHLTRHQAAALVEVTIEELKASHSGKRKVRRVKFKLSDKQGALNLLGRHHKLFTDKVDHHHDHQQTVLGLLLKEIDQEAKAKMRTIEHQPNE